MTMIQIRNVPDHVHRELKARAAKEGLTLSDYLLRMAEREVGRPTIEELSARIQSHGRVELSESPAQIIRRMRDAAG
jgi:plasmid stability protein